MEAVPRLPMISFELKTCTENATFSQSLKQYISQFYGEDPESYNNEIHNLECLRGGAVRPTADIGGIQLLKKYYCQLHFLKSRFPMEELQPAAVYFSWKDNYSNLACSIPDVRFELMSVLYNIGALHSQLGAMDQRTTPDGMKIACSHFQCAAWAFQMLRENYYQMVTYISAVEVVHFMELVCLAQAQECILEKSMMDNRKATIIAKVAVQVVDYYRKAQVTLQGGTDENNYSDYVQVGIFKGWVKYLNFKVAYQKCISLLFQGQQAEEQQKMGERVALYQAAAEQLEAARKLGTSLDNKQEIAEALAFTSDFVEGKKKAAKNENDFIYHEEVPSKDTFQEVKGASLVKGIAFSINDVELSGPDIFARLVPMEAHEVSSLYSERKAEVLRKYGELIESKDQKLAEFMSSMQIDFLSEMRQATGLPQEIVDRAASLSAKPNAIQDLISSMTKLSNTYHEVDSLLNEIQELLKEEGNSEKEYQKTMGERPPSIIATDLSREAAKYREAHNKANESNQNLHRAMVTHVGNLKNLSQPLALLQQQIPSLEISDPNIDESALKEIEMLLGKVEEMKTQRGVLWAQLRDALHKDDITSVLVTRQANESIDDIFKRELDKHQQLTNLIEQNSSAQENIIKAFIDAYAKFSNTRRHLQGVIMKRQATINSLIFSFDSYEDLLAKAMKGIEFYTKLETNVTKLMQRVKSACKVQQEEREQMLSKTPAYEKHEPHKIESNAPKLKDYLNSMKTSSSGLTHGYPSGSFKGNMDISDGQVWPPGIRPTPVGSEINEATAVKYDSSMRPSNSASDGYFGQNKNPYIAAANESYNLNQYRPSGYDQQTPSSGFVPPQLGGNSNAGNMDQMLEKRMSALKVVDNASVPSQQYIPQEYGSYNYMPSPTYNNYANDMKGTNSQLGQPSYGATGQPANIPQPNQYQEAGYNVEARIPDATSGFSPYATQYIPTHYQQMIYPTDNQTGMSYGQSSSNDLYASGYATTQNLRNSDMATVQSGGCANYNSGPSSQTGQPSAAYGGGFGGTGKESQSHLMNTSTGYVQQEVAGQSAFIPSSAMSQTHPAYMSVAQPSETDQSYPNTYGYNVNSFQYDPQQLGGNAGVPETYQNNMTAQQMQLTGGTSNADNLSMFNMPGGNFTYSANYQPNPSVTNLPSQNHNMGQTNYPMFVEGNMNNMSAPQDSLSQPSALSQYSEGYVGAGSLIGQNQINAGSMYTQAGMSYAYNPNNTISSTGGVTSPQCIPNTEVPLNVTNYSYISNSSQNKNEIISNNNSQTKKESSTLDLLSGLEFTISQVPLQPEQKTMEPTPKNPPVEVQNTQSVVIGASQSVGKTLDIEETNKQLTKVIASKALDNEDVKRLFQNEVDKYEKFVDVLSNKTLNGPTTLDLKWKEILDYQESEGAKKIISVARCYPMKNRFPDILPYDHSRVVLRTQTDDYINASFIKDISPFVSPVIITQAPLQSTVSEFWTMLLEQHVEFVMCLLSDKEIGLENIYWPTEKERDIRVSNMVVSLQSIVKKNFWIERLITISIPEKKECSTIVHLQFTEWPGSLFPVCPDPFVTYVRESITLYQKQRIDSNPLVIHCSSGIGRSGVACLLLFAILEATNNSASLPDLCSLTNKITSFRKNILRDREHLKFAYQAFLCYMKQIVSKTGIPTEFTSSPVKEENLLANLTENDPLSSLDPFWASRKDK